MAGSVLHWGRGGAMARREVAPAFVVLLTGSRGVHEEGQARKEPPAKKWNPSSGGAPELPVGSFPRL